MVNENVDLILRSNRGDTLSKLDVENAYDHVEWASLSVMLEKTGFFGERWIGWIKWFASSTSFPV